MVKSDISSSSTMAKSTAETLMTVLNQCNSLKYDECHDYFKIRQEHGMTHFYFICYILQVEEYTERTNTDFVYICRLENHGKWDLWVK